MTAVLGRGDDAALVAQASAGDATAFERLVREHADAVYGHALRFFGDAATAEDAVQEVFLKVFRSLASFDGRASFSTWLYRVTRNVCLDMFRQGRRRPIPVDVLEAPHPESADFSQAVVDSEAVETAIAALPPEDRDALNAVALFGLSYVEAASVLDVPVGTVKSRVFRARRTVIAMLELGVEEA